MLPKLLCTTKESRRVYKFKTMINNRQLELLIIDPHYEIEHSSYINDKVIYNLSKELVKNKNFVLAGKRDQWEYFETDILWENKNYRLVFCLEDKKNYLGIVNCYRKSK